MEMIDLNNFLTIQFLTSFLGVVFITTLTTQFTKELPFIKKIPTRLYNFIIVLFTLFVYTFYGLQDFNLVNITTLIFNSVFISSLENGGYNLTTGKISLNMFKNNITTIENNE